MLLYIAERGEKAEVIIARAFPRGIVGWSPQTHVIIRTGIREHRPRHVDPHARRNHSRTPRLDVLRLIGARIEQTRLHERHGLARMYETHRELRGAETALFVDEFAAFFRDTLDARFDGDAARGTEQGEHVRFPQIDARLHAELDVAFAQGLKQRPVRQKDFVDEIDIPDALRDEVIDLLEHHVHLTFAIDVSMILLGAERSGVGATARGLDLRARAARLCG